MINFSKRKHLNDRLIKNDIVQLMNYVSYVQVNKHIRDECICNELILEKIIDGKSAFIFNDSI
jgi:hypothetical protein